MVSLPTFSAALHRRSGCRNSRNTVPPQTPPSIPSKPLLAAVDAATAASCCAAAPSLLRPMLPWQPRGGGSTVRPPTWVPIPPNAVEHQLMHEADTASMRSTAGNAAHHLPTRRTEADYTGSYMLGHRMLDMRFRYYPQKSYSDVTRYGSSAWRLIERWLHRHADERAS
ncbi:hypothetical protein ACJRO7_022051 [Eucalyptus globulus]|uniref:Uncharacterized protein n=1 Tax=Eucalyptus globulus TaxID=34317 RepID=A0ABD3KNE1_EUCGL